MSNLENNLRECEEMMNKARNAIKDVVAVRASLQDLQSRMPYADTNIDHITEDLQKAIESIYATEDALCDTFCAALVSHSIMEYMQKK